MEKTTKNKYYRRKWLYDKIDNFTKLIILSCKTTKNEIVRRKKERMNMPDDPDFQGKLTFDYIKSNDEEIRLDEFQFINSISFLNITTYKKSIQFNVLYTKNNDTALELILNALNCYYLK